MISKDYIIEKIKSLPDERVKEIIDFIDFMESREKKGELAEYGMDNYLNDLTIYENLLSSGGINWK